MQVIAIMRRRPQEWSRGWHFGGRKRPTMVPLGIEAELHRFPEQRQSRWRVRRCSIKPGWKLLKIDGEDSECILDNKLPYR